MRTGFTIVVSGVVLTLVNIVAYAQSTAQSPNAAGRSSQLGPALEKHRNYRYVTESVFDMTVAGQAVKYESTLSFAFANPDKLHIEVKSGMAPGMTIVGDGEHTWIYLAIAETVHEEGCRLGMAWFTANPRHRIPHREASLDQCHQSYR